MLRLSLEADVQRREFIGLIGGGLFGWSHAAHAQRSRKLPLVGWLGGTSSSAGALNLSAFMQGLRELGYEQGKAFDFAYRWADGNVTRLPSLARELVDMNPDVILAASPPGNVALMQATANIPIVGALTIDPIKLGLAVSHNCPGRNFTGTLFTIDGLPGKQLELLLQLLPDATTIGVLLNADSPTQPFILRDIESALSGRPIRIIPAPVRNLGDLPAAFETLKRERVAEIVMPLEGVFFAGAPEVIAGAAGAGLPAVYDRREHVERGGLASYGIDAQQNFRRASYFVDRILKGSKPGDLPMELPTKFELAINLKTAKALELTIPSKLLFTADVVIE